MLRRAARFDDLRISPANRMKALKGERAGQHGIRIQERPRRQAQEDHALVPAACRL